MRIAVDFFFQPTMIKPLLALINRIHKAAGSWCGLEIIILLIIDLSILFKLQQSKGEWRFAKVSPA